MGTYPEKTPEQARKSLVIRFASEGRGRLGPGWNCTQEIFISPNFTHWCNFGDCFGKHVLCKFPGIKQKEQITKEIRKSPTDKGAISS